jgi:hypothetical protein
MSPLTISIVVVFIVAVLFHKALPEEAEMTAFLLFLVLLVLVGIAIGGAA